MEFIEIEHKYLVDATFDRAAFFADLRAHNPQREVEVVVTDTYFTLHSNPRAVIRHRLDREIQQLTVKSYGGSTETRTEINLELGHHKGDQSAAVSEFCSYIGADWTAALHKRVHAFYFADCEVVYYDAEAGERRCSCVEFESTAAPNEQDGLTVLADYERRFGFDSAQRCQLSLFDLMFPEQAAKLQQSGQS